jgi:hypothetical protein
VAEWDDADPASTQHVLVMIDRWMDILVIHALACVSRLSVAAKSMRCDVLVVVVKADRLFAPAEFGCGYAASIAISATVTKPLDDTHTLLNYYYEQVGNPRTLRS